MLSTIKHLISVGHGRFDTNWNSGSFERLEPQTFTKNKLIEYPELSMERLDPLKLKGALDSITVRILDSGIGISIEGVATNMSFYGCDMAEFQQIEYVRLFFTL